MNNTPEQQALEYLKRNLLHNIGMIRPLERGTAQVLYSGDDGVMLRDTVSDAIMQSVSTYEAGSRLLEQMPGAKLYLIHQDFMLDDFNAKVNMPNVFENFTAAYLSPDPLPTIADMSVKQLDVSDFDVVEKNYGVRVGDEYLIGRFEAGALFGAYVDGEMVGFGGEHEEGSMGMLVILDQHRRKGYAASLVGFGVNRLLEHGLTPFSCVGVDNLASIEMHKKLGFTISSDSVWWLF
ncbi:MAG: GNAT family N-acetyltransferase [Defluviitaleaceae bacterium]|nr:GNAT family N-acetyltransferase [Defluviitaleaceae bacterium]